MVLLKFKFLINRCGMVHNYDQRIKGSFAIGIMKEESLLLSYKQHISVVSQ